MGLFYSKTNNPLTPNPKNRCRSTKKPRGENNPVLYSLLEHYICHRWSGLIAFVINLFFSFFFANCYQLCLWTTISTFVVPYRVACWCIETVLPKQTGQNVEFLSGTQPSSFFDKDRFHNSNATSDKSSGIGNNV